MEENKKQNGDDALMQENETTLYVNVENPNWEKTTEAPQTPNRITMWEMGTIGDSEATISNSISSPTRRLQEIQLFVSLCLSLSMPVSL